jgi:hypothetical protein
LALHIKKTFTCSERSEQARTEFVKLLAKIPEEKRAYIDESGINKPIVRNATVEEYQALGVGGLLEFFPFGSCLNDPGSQSH